MSESVGVSLEIGAENHAQSAVDQVNAQMTMAAQGAASFTAALGLLNDMAAKADTGLARINTRLDTLNSGFRQGAGAVASYTSALDLQMESVTGLAAAFERLAFARGQAAGTGAIGGGYTPPVAAAPAASAAYRTAVSTPPNTRPAAPSVSAPPVQIPYPQPAATAPLAPPPVTPILAPAAQPSAAPSGRGLAMPGPVAPQYGPLQSGRGIPMPGPVAQTYGPRLGALPMPGPVAQTYYPPAPPRAIPMPGPVANLTMAVPPGGTIFAAGGFHPGLQAAVQAAQPTYIPPTSPGFTGFGGSGYGAGALRAAIATTAPPGGVPFSPAPPTGIPFGPTLPPGAAGGGGGGGGFGGFLGQIPVPGGNGGQGWRRFVPNLGGGMGAQIAMRMAGYMAVAAAMRGVYAMGNAGYQLSQAEAISQSQTGASNSDIATLISQTQASGASGNAPYSQLKQINMAYPLMSVGLSSKAAQAIGTDTMHAAASAGMPDALNLSTSVVQTMDAFGMRGANDKQTIANGRLALAQMMVATKVGPYRLDQATADIGMYAGRAHGMGISSGDSMAFLGLEGQGGVAAGQISNDYKSFLTAFTGRITPQQQNAARAMGFHMGAHTIQDFGGIDPFMRMLAARSGQSGPADQSVLVQGLLGNSAASTGAIAVMNTLKTGNYATMFQSMKDQSDIILGGKKGKTQTDTAFDIFQGSDAGKLQDQTAALATAFENLGKAMLPLEIWLTNHAASFLNDASSVINHPGQAFGSVGNRLKELAVTMNPAGGHFNDTNWADIQAIKDTYYRPDTMKKLHAAGDVQNSQGFFGTMDAGGNFQIDRYQGTPTTVEDKANLGRFAPAMHAGQTLSAADSAAGNYANAVGHVSRGGVWGTLSSTGQFIPDVLASGSTVNGYSNASTYGETNRSSIDRTTTPAHQAPYAAPNVLPRRGGGTGQAGETPGNQYQYGIHQFVLGQSSGMGRLPGFIQVDEATIRNAIASNTPEAMTAALAKLKQDMVSNGVPDSIAKMHNDKEAVLVNKALLKDQKVQSGDVLASRNLTLSEDTASFQSDATLRRDYMATNAAQRDQNMYRLAHGEISPLGAENINRQLSDDRKTFDRNQVNTARALTLSDAGTAADLGYRAVQMNSPYDPAAQRKAYMATLQSQRDTAAFQLQTHQIKQGAYANTMTSLGLDAQQYDQTSTINTQTNVLAQQGTAADIGYRAAQLSNPYDPAALRAAYMLTIKSQRDTAAFQQSKHLLAPGAYANTVAGLNLDVKTYDTNASNTTAMLGYNNAQTSSQLTMRAVSIDSPYNLAAQRSAYMANLQTQRDTANYQVAHKLIDPGAYKNTMTSINLDAKAYDKNAADNAYKLAANEQLTAAQLQVQAAQAMHESPALIKAAFLNYIATERSQASHDLKTGAIDKATYKNRMTGIKIEGEVFDYGQKMDALNKRQTALQEDVAYANKTGIGIDQANNNLQSFDTKNAKMLGLDPGFLRNQAYDMANANKPLKGPIERLIRPNAPQDILSADFGQTRARLSTPTQGQDTLHEMLKTLRDQLAAKDKELANATRMIALLEAGGRSTDRVAVGINKLVSLSSSPAPHTPKPHAGFPHIPK